MSSWSQSKQIPNLRLGYKQITPEGKFIKKEKPATVISAYYEMPSKYKKQDYRLWIRIFLESTPCFLVFFTDEELVPFISDCRREYMDRTRIISLPREQWVANTRYSQAEWDKLALLDPEILAAHSADLYKVWYEKNNFVLRAIDLNPCDHIDFVWTDAGICRDPNLAALIKNYPVADRIPTDRMMLLNVVPFVLRDDVIINGFPGGGEDKPRIGGGIIAGSKEEWIKYDLLYNSIVERYKHAGLFWGKDQTIMKTLVLENKSKISLIDAKPIIVNKWFYSLVYLGASETIYALLKSEKTNSKARTYEYLLNGET